ncbi:lipopolysaccharide biosynthesis protein [Flavobacterium urocaniciphilum]|uniref:Membrane protein involved in the export of O-antigen and teichoic acid n=1 Tax=Flavobacterium urocaniciphilum TaxID=1299341 RepID=A0A1H9CZ86_9FLAO|nr:oligosaccharide flippase family protein [Flavobacterium urocaniciphilum]SEQ06515.1 Membrane protein involved in the export of O-antigen and teichoic acid [Flavobacterium urocaniciphilum]
MGIVIKQSIKNTIITFLGFGIGAANTLFMYPYFLGKDFFGLTGYVLSAANILYPIMSFGIQNTLIKFFNENNKTEKELNSYITYMLLVPLFFIIPLMLLFYVFYDPIAQYESEKNSIVYDYVWTIPIIGIFMGYFEIFYAWLRAHMKSVFGSFVKEVFVRILITILLFGVYFNYITPSDFIYSLVLVYGIGLIMIVFYANKVKKIRLHFKTPKNSKGILTFTVFIILSASIANMLLDIDKYMIKHYMKIDNIAFYSVAIFIAMVISVPSRAMHQITYPITAKLMSENKWEELNELYKKSSISLQVIGGLIMLGIFVNINQLYLMLPKEYAQGLLVVFTIGFSKYFDLILGNNNAIIFNSKYYRAVLFLGVMLVILIVLLNMYFIPNFGLNGAAFATLISIGMYSLAKLLFVVIKMKLFPFTKNNIISFVITLALFFGFYFWEFSFHPIINIGLKSVLISILYLSLHYYFKVSSDINYVIRNTINKLLKIKP